jgi:membrane-bound ClpP family serine protease
MLEYRIPIARIISVAVMGVCFFFALIVMNMQAAGRSRAFGVLGIILILASTFLQAANRSQASVYGMNTTAYAAGLIVVAVLAAGGLVLLALAIIWAREPKRVRGGR